MSNLDEYIKKCNLVFTDTVGRLDFCRKDFDTNKAEVNYHDSVNLLHLVSSFNKLYVDFEKEYSVLEKLDLGKEPMVIDFNKFDADRDIYRVLVISIEKSSITKHRNTFLYIREINGEIKPFVTNNINPFDKEYYREDVELDNKLATKYLDLFEKYSVLLDSYKYLRNGQLFGDGTNVMFTIIDDYHSVLLEGLHNFTISFGSLYFDAEYFVDIVMNLGNNLTIDYEKSKLRLDDKEIAKENDYEKILKNVYINKKYTEKENKR